MAVFARRSTGYKFGMIIIILGSVSYLTGYASPFWVVTEDDTSKITQGLWMLCASSPYLFTCQSIGFSGMQIWFHIVRLLSTMGLVLLCGSSIYGIVANCCATVPRHTRTLEALALVGGLTAFAGAMVYLGHVESTDLFRELRTFSWAFYLASVGSGLAILASIVVFITNKPLDALVVEPIGMASVGGYPTAPHVVKSEGNL